MHKRGLYHSEECSESGTEIHHAEKEIWKIERSQENKRHLSPVQCNERRIYSIDTNRATSRANIDKVAVEAEPHLTSMAMTLLSAGVPVTEQPKGIVTIDVVTFTLQSLTEALAASGYLIPTAPLASQDVYLNPLVQAFSLYATNAVDGPLQLVEPIP
jgi:hypothetical protein